MTLTLADIAVRVEPGYGVAGGLKALLNELVQRLDRLATFGESDAIDLRSLPLAPVERDRLAALLGRGEVEATLAVDGTSTIRETAIPGIWWLEHRDARGAVVAETIEITRIPAILRTAVEDVGRGVDLLRARIEAATLQPATEEFP